MTLWYEVLCPMLTLVSQMGKQFKHLLKCAHTHEYMHTVNPKVERNALPL